MFINCGIIHIDKKNVREEDIFDLAINAGADDVIQINDITEIITKKEDFYKIKTILEKKVENLTYSGIEWRALTKLKLNMEQNEKIEGILTSLDELDDVQNIFTNANLKT